MRVSAIAAMARNRCIGLNNQLPWKLPEDLQFFRQTTKGHPCVMGRKTWDSIGAKPLPGRSNFVISRNSDFRAEGAEVFQSVEKCLEYIASHSVPGKEEVFIVGGAEIYRLALPYTHRLYLTEIASDYPGDSFFPEFDRKIFRESERRSRSQPQAFDFVIYDRVS